MGGCAHTALTVATGSVAWVPASTAWEELVAVAVVGTARREVPAGVGDGVGSAPERVLAQAALLAAQRRAGWVAPAAPASLPDPSPDDPRPQASDRALEVLGLLLSGELAVPGGVDALVGEWLARAGAGWRVPAAWLPVVLDRATAHPAQREATRAVGGPRAAWLAERNPVWAWARPPQAEVDVAETWRLGTREERRALLASMRAAAPDRGRDLLASTFASETAADRAAFVAQLETGLAPADEPFLEGALDDRSAPVRAAAARLLDGLPTSARAARMVARTLPLVSVAPAPRATRRALPPAQHADPRLEVGDPPSPDAAARRDGIRDPSPRGASAPRGSLSPRARSARSDPATGSHKAAWLTQLVAATPLTAWPAHLGLPPAAIAALVVGPAPASPGRAASARSAFLEGLEQAATRQRDAEWAEALLRVRPGAVGLLGVLPAARAHALVAAQAATARPPALQGQLGALPGPWPRGLSLAVMGRFAALGAGLSLSPGMLALLSIRLDPGVDAAVLEWAGALPHGGLLRRAAHDLHHALTLRRVIAEELAGGLG